jgi:hypothetical protein
VLLLARRLARDGKLITLQFDVEVFLLHARKLKRRDGKVVLVVFVDIHSENDSMTIWKRREERRESDLLGSISESLLTLRGLAAPSEQAIVEGLIEEPVKLEGIPVVNQ